MTMAAPAATTSSPLVHVLDDDPGLREAFRDLLESVGYEVATYGSTAEFLARDRQNGHGCLLLDVRLPGMSGLDLQEQLARDGIALPVILMTSYGDVPMSVRGMKAGARDFLEKPVRDQDLLDAVADAVEASRRSAPHAERRETAMRNYACLTRREREVMGHVVRGRLNKQIAFALSISEVTVKIHRAGVMRKMQASSIAELGRIAEVLEL
jgi:FixJ family two-component response regulator